MSARYLLEKVSNTRLRSAMLNSRDSESNSPLHSACFKNHVSVVRLLIEYGADLCWRNMNDESPLQVSCQYSSLEIVKLIFEAAAAASGDETGSELDWQMIESAIKRDDAPLMIYLVGKDLSGLGRVEKDGGFRKMRLVDIFDEALKNKSNINLHIFLFTFKVFQIFVLIQYFLLV